VVAVVEQVMELPMVVAVVVEAEFVMLWDFR
jgi:hypothetical protein